MDPAILQRVELLLEQNRLPEAKTLLQQYLSDYPTDPKARFILAYVLYRQDENTASRQLAEGLFAENPEDSQVLRLLAGIDLADDLHEAAESKAAAIIRMEPEDADSYILMSRVKLAKRNYDQAFHYVEKALELDSENIEALNLRTMISGILGNQDTRSSIESALELDPENAHTIASHGWQLVREGKVQEALERLRYALSIDPNNELAQFAMAEALKARFWPYRLLLKYGQFMERMSGQNSWMFLIGAYVAYRVLIGIAETNPALQPFLMPLVYLIMAVFLSTWLLDPLMNLYLLSNPYGRLLLDKEDKQMARWTGISLLAALVFLGAYFLLDVQNCLDLAIISGLMMIPMGSILKPRSKTARRNLWLLVGGAAGIGFLGAITGSAQLFFMGIFGLFIYQWVLNAAIIKENARSFD